MKSKGLIVSLLTAVFVLGMMSSVMAYQVTGVTQEGRKIFLNLEIEKGDNMSNIANDFSFITLNELCKINLEKGLINKCRLIYIGQKVLVKLPIEVSEVKPFFQAEISLGEDLFVSEDHLHFELTPIVSYLDSVEREVPEFQEAKNADEILVVAMLLVPFFLGMVVLIAVYSSNMRRNQDDEDPFEGGDFEEDKEGEEELLKQVENEDSEEDGDIFDIDKVDSKLLETAVEEELLELDINKVEPEIFEEAEEKQVTPKVLDEFTMALASFSKSLKADDDPNLAAVTGITADDIREASKDQLVDYMNRTLLSFEKLMWIIKEVFKVDDLALKNFCIDKLYVYMKDNELVTSTETYTCPICEEKIMFKNTNRHFNRVHELSKEEK